MQNQNKKQNISKLRISAGFTLVELLTVVAIISILASFVFNSLNSSKAKARDAIRIDAIKSLSLASEVYFSENYDFPNSLDDLKPYFTNNVLPINPQTTDGSGFFYEKITKDKSQGIMTNGYCIGVMLEIAPETSADCGAFIANYKVKGP